MKQIGSFIILIITAFSALAWEPTKPVNVVIAYRDQVMKSCLEN